MLSIVKILLHVFTMLNVKAIQCVCIKSIQSNAKTKTSLVYMCEWESK